MPPLYVADLAKNVLAEYGSSCGVLLAANWLDDKYREVVTKAKFKHLREVGNFLIPGQYNTGNATFTENSNIVNFAGGTVLSSAMVDRYIRVSIQWYRITDVVSTTQCLIDPPFGESASAPAFAAAAFTIVTRYIDLPPDRRWLGTFLHMRLRKSFTLKSLDELDAIDAERYSVDSNGPLVGAEVGLSPQTGGKRIELYPYCSNDEVIGYVFWKLPNKLQLGDVIPAVIDGFALKEGALVSLCRWEAGQALRAGKADIGGNWNNMAKTHDTKWMGRVLPQMIGSSNGDDDATVIWQSARFLNTQPNRGDYDVTNAQDYIWNKPL